MVSPLEGRLDVTKKSGGSNLPPLLDARKTNLIARLAARRPAGRHLVFHALAADVHALLCRDPAAVRLAVPGKGICLVRLDSVVCP
jgi:hypothetical protein